MLLKFKRPCTARCPRPSYSKANIDQKGGPLNFENGHNRFVRINTFFSRLLSSPINFPVLFFEICLLNIYSNNYKRNGRNTATLSNYII